MRLLLIPILLVLAGCSTHHGSVKELLVGQTPICMPPCASPCAILPEGWTMESCGQGKAAMVEVPAHVFEGAAFRPRVTHTEPVVEVPSRIFDATGIRHAPANEVPSVRVPAAVFDSAGLHRAPVAEIEADFIEEASDDLPDVTISAEDVANAVNRRKALELEVKRLRELEAERLKYAPAHPNALPPVVPPVVPEVKCYPPRTPITRSDLPSPPPPPIPASRK